MKRVVAVICTLTEKNLAFRGSNESFGKESNGNFIGLLELISKFDPFLSEHVENYGNVGSGKTNYLSKTVCDELVALMAKKVLQSISNEVKNSKYFGLSVDSTPDISHKDQICIILRYVDDTTFEPFGRFINFVQVEDHSGEKLAEVTINFLDSTLSLDISNCRSQSYDNAPNMSGKCKGMKTKILNINKLATFLPCAAHSLNLVGSSGVDCCIESINFFGIVQQIYNFFSSSTKRWAVLEKFSDRSVKPLSETRWSARADSVNKIYRNYEDIEDSLNEIAQFQVLTRIRERRHII